jgi:hypothetical protein
MEQNPAGGTSEDPRLSTEQILPLQYQQIRGQAFRILGIGVGFS